MVDGNEVVVAGGDAELEVAGGEVALEQGGLLPRALRPVQLWQQPLELETNLRDETPWRSLLAKIVGAFSVIITSRRFVSNSDNNHN